MLPSTRMLAVRALSTSARSSAAAAASSAPVKRTYTPRASAVRKPAAAARSAPAAPTPAPPPAAPPAPAASAVEPSFDDFDDADFRLPEPEISDYAHLRRAAPVPSPAPSRAAARPYAAAAPQQLQPTPSPPLSVLPDASYVPLPSASLGNPALMDAYVFNGNGSGNGTGYPAASSSSSSSSSKIVGEVAAADWTTSFKGLSERPFDKDAADALLKLLDPEDVEIKPDGLLYLPEIKYRRTLNAAFGPGGWGMAPRGETHVGPKIVSREWGLVCLGRLVAIARGEQEYFDPSGVPTATEACKSNALMRCCKDLGIASELWDPRFIREFKAKYCVEMMVEHVTQKKKRKLWRKKAASFDYPYREVGPAPK